MIRFRDYLTILCFLFLVVSSTALYGAKEYGVNDADMLWTKRYGDELVKHLEQAEEEIYVLQYLIMGRGYVPDVQNILETLKQKSREGVEVTIITDGSREGEYGNPINSMLYNYFDTGPVNVTVLSPNQVMHSKVVIIDREKSFIGSQNWSKDGLTKNVELAVYVEDESFSSNLQDQLVTSLEDRLEESILSPGEKSINEVTRKELMSLPIIGRHFADQILEFRRSRGKIRSLSELNEIGGVGEKRMKVLENYFGDEARQEYRQQEKQQ